MMFPMKSRMQGTLIAALLLAPFAAYAQDQAPPGAPAASPPPAVAERPAPAGPDNGDLAWFDDEMFGFDADLEQDQGPGGEHGAMGHGDGGEGIHGFAMRGAPGGRMGMLHRRMGARFAELDLSDAQREKLRDLHDAQARKAIQRRADMQLARMDLHKLMRSEKVDMGGVNTQIDRMARMHADAMKAAFEAHQQARAVLTPEQMKRLRNGPGPRMERHMMDGEPLTPRR